MSDAQRIYVASLSDYNAGRLHGAWIDATLSPDDIQEEVNAMLAKSTEDVAEEWAIHDYEGFGQIKLSEHESFEKVSMLANAITEHGDAFAAWAAYEPDYNDEVDKFLDEYQGTYDSEEAYAEEFVDDIGLFGDLKDDHPAVMYFDFEKYARDLFINDVYGIEDGGQIHVFRRV